MIYRLTFLEKAEKEWNKLSPEIRNQFRKKLERIVHHPHIPNSSLSGMRDCYKLKAKGYRLVYRVFDDRLVVQIVAIGKRENDEVYDDAKNRLH